jgi:hypothetical protein
MVSPARVITPMSVSRKAHTRKDGGKCCKGCTLPSLGGLPALVGKGRAGVRFARFVGLRSLNQWNNSEVLHREDYKSCQCARPKHRHHQFSKLIHLSLSDKGTHSRGVCRERRCARA